MKNRYIVKAVCILVCISSLLCGCGVPFQKEEVDQIVLTTGFEKDEVFRIGTAICKLDEFVLYLTNTQNRYENVYGSEIWNVKTENVTLEDKLKDSVGAQLAQIKTMNLLAIEKGVGLTEEDKRIVATAANEYFSGLNAKEKEYLNLTEEAVVKYYSEYLIAHKVYTYIIRDINPEISDDEARTVTVEWIYKKSEGNDDAIKNTLYNTLARIRSGEDFDTVAMECSDDKSLVHSFGKGEKSVEVESVAFTLAEGEVSDVFFSQDGYYIIKCLSTLDRAETDENKIKIIEQRKNEAFNEVYGSFAKEQIKQFHDETWGNISLIHDEAVKTSDFFVIYEKYFGDIQLQ